MNSGTKFVFLHGPPATGKLTIAKTILQVVPGRLFDNHSSIDLAKTIFDFGAAGFWELVNKIRSDAIESAVRHRVPLLIYTSCYSHPEDYGHFEEMEAIVLGANGSVLPAFLSCSIATLKARVRNQDRIERGKVTSPTELDKFLADWNMAPVPRPNCLKLDTEKSSPWEIAEKVVRHFGLKA